MCTFFMHDVLRRRAVALSTGRALDHTFAFSCIGRWNASPTSSDVLANHALWQRIFAANTLAFALPQTRHLCDASSVVSKTCHLFLLSNASHERYPMG